MHVLTQWVLIAGVTVLSAGSVRAATIFNFANFNNCTSLQINGNAAFTVKDSQFIVRKLESTGGAVFTMQPQPSLPIRFPSLTYELVR